LIIVGLNIIVRVTGIINFAHGQFYLIGAYVFWFTYIGAHLHVVLSVILSLLALLLLGALSYRGIFHFVQVRFTATTPLSQRLLLSAMASVGLMMILSQGTLYAFGTEERGIPSLFPQLVTIGDIRLPMERLVVIALGLLVSVGLYLFLYKTKLGKSMRAVSSDADVSWLQGINSHRVFLLSFTLGCGLAGLAGIMIAPIYAVSQTMGTDIIFTAFLILTVGGVGSYKGGILGAIVAAALLVYSYTFIGGLSQLLLYVIAGIILTFKPGGIAGEALD
jgi:branched-chain amino acid transport system permease protein